MLRTALVLFIAVSFIFTMAAAACNDDADALSFDWVFDADLFWSAAPLCAVTPENAVVWSYAEDRPLVMESVILDLEMHEKSPPSFLLPAIAF